jgi:hypothetical protein
MNECVNEIIERLDSLSQEESVPRNMKIKIKSACEALSCDDPNIAIKINKSLQELEDVSSDVNTPSDIKTALWSITSELECIK